MRPLFLSPLKTLRKPTSIKPSAAELLICAGAFIAAPGSTVVKHYGLNRPDQKSAEYLLPRERAWAVTGGDEATLWGWSSSPDSCRR
jgi:hypothetical protein